MKRRTIAIAVPTLLASMVMGSSARPVPGPRQEARSLAGLLLVASPEMGDPRFTRTVIYMVRHDAQGAMGLVINRPIGHLPLAGLLEQLGLSTEGVTGDVRVHYGGPVEASQGFVLHTTDFSGAATRVVKNGVAMTSTPDVIRAIATGKGPRRRLLTLGYAGWGPGQLEGELARGAWVVAAADEALVFDENDEGKWRRAMDRQLIDL